MLIVTVHNADIAQLVAISERLAAYDGMDITLQAHGPMLNG